MAEPGEGLAIIDDPRVDLGEAEARRLRAAVNDWWASTAAVRQATSTVGCVRCSTPAQGVCCSSHGKQLCHRCYRRTHLVEVCVEGCKACQAEGLPVVMSS